MRFFINFVFKHYIDICKRSNYRYIKSKSARQQMYKGNPPNLVSFLYQFCFKLILRNLLFYPNLYLLDRHLSKLSVSCRNINNNKSTFSYFQSSNILHMLYSTEFSNNTSIIKKRLYVSNFVPKITLPEQTSISTGNCK